jgi:hypothetical protein
VPRFRKSVKDDESILARTYDDDDEEEADDMNKEAE